MISVLIYDLNESGDLGAISVIGLAMLIITFAVVIAINRIPGFGQTRFRHVSDKLPQVAVAQEAGAQRLPP